MKKINQLGEEQYKEENIEKEDIIENNEAEDIQE